MSANGLVAVFLFALAIGSVLILWISGLACVFCGYHRLSHIFGMHVIFVGFAFFLFASEYNYSAFEMLQAGALVLLLAFVNAWFVWFLGLYSNPKYDVSQKRWLESDECLPAPTENKLVSDSRLLHIHSAFRPWKQ